MGQAVGEWDREGMKSGLKTKEKNYNNKIRGGINPLFNCTGGEAKLRSYKVSMSLLYSDSLTQVLGRFKICFQQL